MKNIIRKWLDLPTREELYDRIDQQVLKRSTKHHNKLRKVDRDRYKNILTQYDIGDVQGLTNDITPKKLN